MIRRTFNWREWDQMRREMDRLFAESFPRVRRAQSSGFPAINVWTNDAEGAVLTTELPGIDSEDIDISVTGDTLTISGCCKPSEAPESAQYHRRERSRGDFSRTVQLPYTINPDQVEARVDKGILTVILPRAEAEKPRQIAVRMA
ncbi:MAG TPA: Hsp20/alpha crystallin family protein [Anaerolineae bacterium]|jgi:HSP20 family protein|nr:Hsp20/alpha crystallin family protein [Anaerolineae bacterium]